MSIINTEGGYAAASPATLVKQIKEHPRRVAFTALAILFRF